MFYVINITIQAVRYDSRYHAVSSSSSSNVTLGLWLPNWNLLWVQQKGFHIHGMLMPDVSWFPHEICFGFYNVSTCSALFATQCKMHSVSTWNHRKPCFHIEFGFPHGTMFAQVMSHFHPLCFQWLVCLMIYFLRLALLLRFLVFLQVYLVFFIAFGVNTHRIG